MDVGLTYVIPDLHGRFDLLTQAIEKIAAHASGRDATVITLGDYIDRGPDSRRVIETLIDWPFRQLRLVALKGNHEEMMWQTCSKPLDPQWWVRNGGDQTLRSYGQAQNEPANLQLIPTIHLEWIRKLPLFYVDNYRIYVHAAIDPAISLTAQNSKILLWKRYPEDFDRGHGRRYVVHGHDARINGPIILKHRTNLDAMAWKTGRLVVGVFDDNASGQAVQYLEVHGKSAN